MPGQVKGVNFTLNADKLKFWTKDQQWKAQAGKFNIWVGKNCL